MHTPLTLLKVGTFLAIFFFGDSAECSALTPAFAAVIGSPAAIGDGASHGEDMDCSVRPQGVTKAKMQR
jgi:hypothetical protein